jgi:hypothetical protein
MELRVMQVRSGSRVSRVGQRSRFKDTQPLDLPLCIMALCYFIIPLWEGSDDDRAETKHN